MSKGKDQFSLNSTMAAAGKKILGSQPTSAHNVPGANVNTIGKRPSASRNVKGLPGK